MTDWYDELSKLEEDAKIFDEADYDFKYKNLPEAERNKAKNDFVNSCISKQLDIENFHKGWDKEFSAVIPSIIPNVFDSNGKMPVRGVYANIKELANKTSWDKTASALMAFWQLSFSPDSIKPSMIKRTLSAPKIASSSPIEKKDSNDKRIFSIGGDYKAANLYAKISSSFSYDWDAFTKKYYEKFWEQANNNIIDLVSFHIYFDKATSNYVANLFGSDGLIKDTANFYKQAKSASIFREPTDMLWQLYKMQFGSKKDPNVKIGTLSEDSKNFEVNFKSAIEGFAKNNNLGNKSLLHSVIYDQLDRKLFDLIPLDDLKDLFFKLYNNNAIDISNFSYVLDEKKIKKLSSYDDFKDIFITTFGFNKGSSFTASSKAAPDYIFFDIDKQSNSQNDNNVLTLAIPLKLKANKNSSYNSFSFVREPSSKAFNEKDFYPIVDKPLDQFTIDDFNFETVYSTFKTEVSKIILDDTAILSKTISIQNFKDKFKSLITEANVKLKQAFSSLPSLNTLKTKYTAFVDNYRDQSAAKKIPTCVFAKLNSFTIPKVELFTDITNDHSFRTINVFYNLTAADSVETWLKTLLDKNAQATVVVLEIYNILGTVIEQVTISVKYLLALYSKAFSPDIIFDNLQKNGLTALPSRNNRMSPTFSYSLFPADLISKQITNMQDYMALTSEDIKVNEIIKAFDNTFIYYSDQIDKLTAKLNQFIANKKAVTTLANNALTGLFADLPDESKSIIKSIAKNYYRYIYIADVDNNIFAFRPGTSNLLNLVNVRKVANSNGRLNELEPVLDPFEVLDNPVFIGYSANLYTSGDYFVLEPPPKYTNGIQHSYTCNNFTVYFVDTSVDISLLNEFSAMNDSCLERNDYDIGTDQNGFAYCWLTYSFYNDLPKAVQKRTADCGPGLYIIKFTGLKD